jgi:hypothetical protein
MYYFGKVASRAQIPVVAPIYNGFIDCDTLNEKIIEKQSPFSHKTDT